MCTWFLGQTLCRAKIWKIANTSKGFFQTGIKQLYDDNNHNCELNLETVYKQVVVKIHIVLAYLYNLQINV